MRPSPDLSFLAVATQAGGEDHEQMRLARSRRAARRFAPHGAKLLAMWDEGSVQVNARAERREPKCLFEKRNENACGVKAGSRNLLWEFHDFLWDLFWGS
jgi:hypothetical protein